MSEAASGESQYQERYQELVGRLMSVREEERSQLALQIHNTIGQSLTGVKLDLALVNRHVENGDQPAASATLKLASSAVDEAIKLLRRIGTALHSPLLDHIGLAAAIDADLKAFTRASGVQVELETRGDCLSLTAEERVFFYRIFQKSLGNISKYATATTITVSLTELHPGASLRIECDGPKFDGQDSQNALDILEIQEWARLINARVTIPGRTSEVLLIEVRSRAGR